MGKRNSKVDAYIEKAAPFAQPILERIREIVHETCPEVEEDIKWKMPFFLYKGMLCHMAAFKAHCALGIWREKAAAAAGGDADRDGMGDFGKLTTVRDLPPKKVLVQRIKAAMKLKEAGASRPRPAKRPEPKAFEVPAELARALAANASARKAFEAMPPSHRREYAEWIAEAKTEATRERRIATALEWLAEGKPRNWKYMKK